jgi:hypothetical protein
MNHPQSVRPNTHCAWPSPVAGRSRGVRLGLERIILDTATVGCNKLDQQYSVFITPWDGLALRKTIARRAQRDRQALPFMHTLGISRIAVIALGVGPLPNDNLSGSRQPSCCFFFEIRGRHCRGSVCLGAQRTVFPCNETIRRLVLSRDGREGDLLSLLNLLLQNHCQDLGGCNIQKGGG